MWHSLIFLKMKSHNWASVILCIYSVTWQRVAALWQCFPIHIADDSPISILKLVAETTLCIFYLPSVFAVGILKESLGEMTGRGPPKCFPISSAQMLPSGPGPVSYKGRCDVG